MSCASPTAPPLESIEETMTSFQYDVLPTQNDDSGSFKSAYLQREPFYRSFDENTNCTDFLAKLLPVCATVDENFHKLMKLENIFLCYVGNEDKHSAALALENVIQHVENVFSASADVLYEIANSLRVEKQHYKAMLYYQASVVLSCRKTTNNFRKITRLKMGILGLKHLSDEFVSRSNTVIVTNHIVPLMKEWIQMIRNQMNVKTDDKAKALTWSLVFLSLTQLGLKSWIDVRSGTEEGKRCMLEAFQSEAPRYWVYGVCSHYRGKACYYMGNYKEAVEELNKSLKYRQSAEDYRSAEDRRQKVEMTRTLLKLAQQKCL